MASNMSTLPISADLRIEGALGLARRTLDVVFDDVARARMVRARAVIEAYLGEHTSPRYGINTGFGALAEHVVADSDVRALQLNLVRSHACGVDAPLDLETTRLVMLLRAKVLAAGHSGVRPIVVGTLVDMLARGVHPVIPSKGSVGASGDLAPLAHLALVLVGEGQAEFEGRVLPGGEAMHRAGIAPLVLEAKEGLALINGTQVMTALTAVALVRAEMATRNADVAGAMTLEASMGTSKAFDPRIHALRPYEGQRKSAGNLRRLLANSTIYESHHDCSKVQDPYSLRCMPQVHGASREGLAYVRRTIEIELNAVTDNPLIFPDISDADDSAEAEILSGGNFHGQPVALCADTGTVTMATLQNIAERRIEQLVNPHLSSGLPPFLAGNPGLQSGFMIAQVTAAALVSEAKGLATPASVDSIPSSANREDHVSMGPIAARRFLEATRHAEYVLGIELLCAARGLDLRLPLEAGAGVRAAWRTFREHIAPFDGDRVLAPDIEMAARLVREGLLVAAAEAVVGPLE